MKRHSGMNTAVLMTVIGGGLPTPAAPTLDTPADSAVIAGFTTTLQWNDVPGAATYDVQIATDSGFVTVVQSATGLLTSEYTINPALLLRNYYWRARGVNTGGVAGSWSTARQFITSQVVFTQAVGGELLTDGGLENWNSATDLTSWTETVLGGSSVNREATEKHGGSFAARYDVSPTNGFTGISQNIVAAANNTLEITGWGKASAGSKTFIFAAGSVTGEGHTLPTAAYAQFTDLLRIDATSTFSLNRSAGTSASLYFDDLSAIIVTLNAVQTGTANSETVFTFALPASPFAGERVSIRYRVNGTTPLLDYMVFMLVRNDANTAWKAQLRKSVSGTISTPAGWSDVADVGTPDALKVVANADKHNVYTGVAGVYTQRGSEITDTTQQTSTGVRAVYSSTVTGDKQIYSIPL